MKIKAFVIFFMICWCFTLVGFGQQEIPDPPYSGDPNDPNNPADPVLDKKIEEIMSVLNMHRLYDLEEQTVAHFQKLLTSNKLVFKKAVRQQGKKAHPLVQEQIYTSNKIAAYWRGLREVGQFRFEIVDIQINTIIEDPSTIEDFEIDKDADVTIRYSHNPESGEISFTLYHMKRCTWD